MNKTDFTAHNTDTTPNSFAFVQSGDIRSIISSTPDDDLSLYLPFLVAFIIHHSTIIPPYPATKSPQDLPIDTDAIVCECVYDKLSVLAKVC